MKRNLKRNSGIYEFLSNSGILEHGSPAEIEQAKKKYWSAIRKEYKRQKRQECKSYTVFFDRHEVLRLTPKAQQMNSTITRYIKQAALMNGYSFDREAIGKLRERLILHYSAIEQLHEEQKLPEEATKALLQQVVAIEQTVFSVLPKHIT